MTSSSRRASFSRPRSRRAGSGFSSGFSRPSSAAGWLARWLASDGAAPSTAAIRSSSAGIALEQRQQLHPGRLARQERVEPVEHRVGLRLAGERGQHARQQLRQQFARARRTQRPHMPRLPAAHRRDDAIGAAEPKRAQRGDGGLRRGVDAAEIQLQRRLGRAPAAPAPARTPRRSARAPGCRWCSSSAANSAASA